MSSKGAASAAETTLDGLETAPNDRAGHPPDLDLSTRMAGPRWGGRAPRRPRPAAHCAETNPDYAALAAASRRLQGLPPRVVDAGVLERVTRVLTSACVPPRSAGPAAL